MPWSGALVAVTRSAAAGGDDAAEVVFGEAQVLADEGAGDEALAGLRRSQDSPMVNRPAAAAGVYNSGAGFAGGAASSSLMSSSGVTFGW
ncbi:hypothetical protein [Amycolatopsis australiensis]|uniref:hypothetical protein n=1 Tax=Amycolatopsis australiensis TaxID=546364 RepID=UPI0015A70348|nr:hypothetical protein [Amycolatopsis australiensis]